MVRVLRTSQFERWITKLKDERGKLRILRRIDRLANGNPGDVAPIGRGVSELRLDVGPGYRIYFLQEGEVLILLLCGGDKSTQTKDIARAHELASEWRSDQDDSTKED